MPHTTTLIIGAGQAGLAMSRCLTERSIDHVVLERGTVANSWRTERWDSLRLLTPSWQSRLPGFHYTGDDPDGYMTMPEIARYLDQYASSFSAPVQDQTTVLGVEPIVGDYPGYAVQTDQGAWYARTVVIASGACSTPAIPAMASDLPGHIHQLAPTQYRNPEQLPDGGVMVVGASASGLQLADELARSGRRVTLAAGRHARMPRTYRGMDIQWWLDVTGVLDARYDRVPNIEKARRAPSLQLIGTPEGRTIDLGKLVDQGVDVVGHMQGVDNGRAVFADDLGDSIARADLKLRSLLDRCDDHALTNGLETELGHPSRPLPIDVGVPRTRVDLAAEGIGTVIWATGFRPNYPWLHCPVFGAGGHIRHDGGVVVDAPGMYVMGLPFMRRRKSTFIDGVGDDARDLSAHLVGHLDRVPLRVAVS